MKPLICFDLWRTLAWEPLSSRDYFVPLFQKYPGVDPRVISERINQTIMCTPTNLALGIRMILQELNIRDEQILLQIVANWESSCGGARLFPDTTFVLKELRRDFQLALITNTSRYGWEQLEKNFRLTNLFDRVYLSFKIGMVKPNPALFKKVTNEFGVPESACTMIGDSQESDIEPAKKLGWNTVLITNGITRELLLRLRNDSES